MRGKIQKVIREYYPSLSKGQKKVAAFITDNLEESSILTASGLGEKVGHSETTVIRLAYVLGFQGFSDMQRSIRTSWLGDKAIIEKGTNQNESDFKVGILQAVAERERQIFEQVFEQLDFEELKKAVEAVIQANQVYVGGFGNSYAAAYSFYHALMQLKSYVYLSNPDGMKTEDLVEFDSDSLVVIFSFPRYRKEARDLGRLAKKLGATILTFTNKQLSPVAQISDIVITTEENTESDYHSIAPVISVAELIGQAVMEKMNRTADERQQRLEILYNYQKLFLE